jgi:hypothetical protein
MLLKSLLILLILVSSGCLQRVPRPPARPECQLIRTEDPQDNFLYCIWSDTKSEYTIRVNDLPVKAANDQEIYVCTTLKGFVDIKAYEKSLQSWITNNCRR